MSQGSVEAASIERDHQTPQGVADWLGMSHGEMRKIVMKRREIPYYRADDRVVRIFRRDIEECLERCRED